MTPQQLLDLRMNEPVHNGSVVRAKVAFPGSPKSYTYSAIKAGGQWYITGRDGAVGRSWGQLIDLLCRDNAEILSAETATTWENL